MHRILLLLVLIAVPAQAAPRLKPKKPAPGIEAARIEAIRAERDRIRTAGTPEEREQLNRKDVKVEALIRVGQLFEGLSPAERAILEQDIQRSIDQDGLQDLYDLEMYDRKKAAGRK